MNNLSRVLLVPVLAFALVSCGDDDGDDRREAAVEACRTYELNGGGGTPALSQELSGILTGGSYEAEPLKAQIARVRDAAAEAGRTEDLSTKQFALYREVVAAAEQVIGDVDPASDIRTLTDEAVSALRTADKALRSACD